jgi:Ser/Thr protein kinase RdoA (MazF antagonist)
VNDAAVVGRILREYHHRGIEPAAIRRVGGTVRGECVTYRITPGDAGPWLVRACRADAPVPVQFRPAAATMLDWLVTVGSTLACLEDGGYRAPRVIRTWAGDLVGLDGMWLTLATTYVPGAMLRPSLPQLRMLGAALGELHALDPVARPGPATWSPDTAVPATLARLDGIGPRVPGDWQSMHAEFRRTALEVDGGLSGLPRGVVHGDAWPGHAVQTSAGSVTLIDWETGGLGLPVVDLGSCLLECLLDMQPRAAGPQAWHVQPDEDRIAAVAQGYSARRTLSAPERALLPAAIRFGAAYVGAIHFEQALAGGVHGASMDARLDRLRNRLAVSPAVARLAARHLGRDGEDRETVR